MAYRLAHAVWLARQVDRVRGTLVQNMDPTQDYTLPDLLSLCDNLGLHYSGQEYAEIGAVLLAEGFLVEV